MDGLEELRLAAARRRAARDRVATARWHGNIHSPEFDVLRNELAAAVRRWAGLIPEAVQEGHAVAEVARAAGIAPPSVYYRLRTAASSTGPDIATHSTVADQVNQVRP